MLGWSRSVDSHQWIDIADYWEFASHLTELALGRGKALLALRGQMVYFGDMKDSEKIALMSYYLKTPSWLQLVGWLELELRMESHYRALTDYCIAGCVMRQLNFENSSIVAVVTE